MSIELKCNPNKCKSLIFLVVHDKVKVKLDSETIPTLDKEENKIYLGVPSGVNFYFNITKKLSDTGR